MQCNHVLDAQAPQIQCWMARGHACAHNYRVVYVVNGTDSLGEPYRYETDDRDAAIDWAAWSESVGRLVSYEIPGY